MSEEKKIGIFFGSDTGNTENVASLISENLASYSLACDIYDIADITKSDITKYDTLLFGVPTWYYGEMQSDWDDFLEDFAQIDFTNKKVALFGLGDQEDYGDYFLDSMGDLFNIVKKNGANISGFWQTQGYNFSSSKAVVDNMFVGLALDEDRQGELTDSRIKSWCAKIVDQMQLK